MSKTTDKVIDEMNDMPRRPADNDPDIIKGGTYEARVEGYLRKRSKRELYNLANDQADKARDLSQKLQEAYTEIALLKEQDQTAALSTTVAAHEKTIADLEGKVKELGQWPAIAHEVVRNNTRLTTTLDNMAKAAAGLVPNTVAPR